MAKNNIKKIEDLMAILEEAELQYDNGFITATELRKIVARVYFEYKKMDAKKDVEKKEVLLNYYINLSNLGTA